LASFRASAEQPRFLAFNFFLFAEFAIAVLPGFRVRPPLLPRGIAYDRDQGQAVWPSWLIISSINRIRDRTYCPAATITAAYGEFQLEQNRDRSTP
jgi:hypothetical protein